MSDPGKVNSSRHLDDLGVNTIIRLAFAIVGLMLILVLISLIPGFDRLIPGLPITFAGIVSIVVSLVLVVVLLRLAQLAKNAILEIGQESELSVRGAGIMYWLFIFLAIVTTYEGFGIILEPIIVEEGFDWFFDLAFFLLSLIPILLIGYHLFKILDPLTDFTVQRVKSFDDPQEPDDQ